MTRERDRIQENANGYIVKNCPSILPMTKLCDSESMFNCGTYCKDCTDCVIKQVIEKCKYIIDDDICLECNKFERGLDCFECDYDGHREDIMRGISRVSLAKQILQLFDIEEINK
jgi:hypothetical protein